MLIDSEYISIYFTVCSVEVGIASEVSDRWEIEEFESECEHQKEICQSLTQTRVVL